MAKRSSTVYLEERFWEMIDKYQDDYNMGSRNDAFQMILQEWSILKKIDFNNIKVNVNISSIEDKITTKSNVENTISEENITSNHEEKEKVDPRITNGIFKIADSLKTEGD